MGSEWTVHGTQQTTWEKTGGYGLDREGKGQRWRQARFSLDEGTQTLVQLKTENGGELWEKRPLKGKRILLIFFRQKSPEVFMPAGCVLWDFCFGTSPTSSPVTDDLRLGSCHLADYSRTLSRFSFSMQDDARSFFWHSYSRFSIVAFSRLGLESATTDLTMSCCGVETTDCHISYFYISSSFFRCAGHLL